MSVNSWRGVVGVIKPTHRPGSLEEFTRLLPEGIGVVPLVKEMEEKCGKPVFTSGMTQVEAYPAQKITYVIPHKPGGGHDVYARAISPYLTKYLQQVTSGSRGGQLLLKKEPVKMAVGSYGRANHVCGIIINEKMKTNFKLIALLRGDVHTSIVSEDAVKPLIDAKEVKVLLVFDEKSEYPGATSIKELGFPELADDISSHRFIVAPPKLATEPKRILLEALKKVNADRDFLAWAKKAEFPLRNLYGSDAEKTFLKIIKSYEELAPLLKKHFA